MDIPGRRFDYGKSLWTEWFTRGGDGIIVRAEALNWVTSSMTLYIDVYSKKSTEPGDGSQVGSWRLTLSAAAGVQQAIYTSVASEANGPGMYDMVRLKVTTNSGSAGDWIVARIFPPIFFDKAS